jgi:hypothetical protein
LLSPHHAVGPVSMRVYRADDQPVRGLPQPFSR